MRFLIWQSIDTVKISKSCYCSSSLKLLIYTRISETLEKNDSALRVIEKFQINDIGSLPDIDNSVDYTFEIPL